MALAELGPICQIGYIVADLDEAVAHWTKTMGVAPWMIFRNVVLTGHFHGAPCEVKIDVALSYQGEIQIELIDPVSTSASPYHGPDGKILEGIHHVAWISDDLAGTVARAKARGLSVAFQGGNASTQVAYMETPGQKGVLYEFIQGADTRAMIEAGVQAARAWDGGEPIQMVVDFEEV
jgi:catechol 2,3-dioxygenase-like lactoylglutathione lyase family enzyme